jgi:ABC-type Fe2+-enterobactin transport system substrate-binding protein
VEKDQEKTERLFPTLEYEYIKAGLEGIAPFLMGGQQKTRAAAIPKRLLKTVESMRVKHK